MVGAVSLRSILRARALLFLIFDLVANPTATRITNTKVIMTFTPFRETDGGAGRHPCLAVRAHRCPEPKPTGSSRSVQGKDKHRCANLLCPLVAIPEAIQRHGEIGSVLMDTPAIDDDRCITVLDHGNHDHNSASAFTYPNLPRVGEVILRLFCNFRHPLPHRL